MPGRLENKVILITGAARNPGAVFARRMAAEGDHVFIADILCEDWRRRLQKLQPLTETLWPFQWMLRRKSRGLQPSAR